MNTEILEVGSKSDGEPQSISELVALKRAAQESVLRNAVKTTRALIMDQKR